MDRKILLCTDLDRTILPNGRQEESAAARPLFKRLAAHPQLRLAYVSGRDQGLIQEAVRQYDIPMPDYAIGDVGTTISAIGPDGVQHPILAWEEEIGADWHGLPAERLAALFSDLTMLRLQEQEKQNRFKLSYYAPDDADLPALRGTLRNRLAAKGIRATIVTSIDEMNHIGLVDVLPARASKLHAIELLIREEGFRRDRTIFAGDSGNDLEVLASGLNAVLVRNATAPVRAEALAAARRAGHPETLYLARGSFLNLNGNYSAGVIEGLVHFLPEVEEWLRPGT